MPNTTIHPATPKDIPLILTLIKELASYEKLAHLMVATEELLFEALFSEHPSAECILAYHNDTCAGFALFFHNFSTFLGRKGLYIEDIYVREALRGLGIGKKLFLSLAQIAHDRGCGRMEWSVLDWNQPAIDFYLNMQAVPMNEWTVHRLNAKSIAMLISQANP